MGLCVRIETLDARWRHRGEAVVRFDSSAERRQLAILEHYLALPPSKREERKQRYLARLERSTEC